MTNANLIQIIPPAVVGILLLAACYFFYTRYVKKSRELCASLEKIGATVRSMIDGDETMRQTGVGRVFQGTELDPIWREFSKTLHTQTSQAQGQLKRKKSRITVPASYYFSVSSVVDRPLGVEYFKHLPGILTGIGIIGTFSGLLFGLSSFDASDPEKMAQSVSLLLGGVRDAFYASAAAITVAMIITHWEKMAYRRCLIALDILVDSLNGLFEGGVGEEYLATLVEHSASSNDQTRSMKDEMIQAMVPVIRQLESIQTQQLSGLAQALEQALNESNKRLVIQLENALIRQVKGPIEEMSARLDNRISQNKNAPQEMALKVIRARQQENTAPYQPEAF